MKYLFVDNNNKNNLKIQKLFKTSLLKSYMVTTDGGVSVSTIPHIY